MDPDPQANNVIGQIAEFARGTQRSIVYFLLAGVVASGYIMWRLYLVEAPLLVNVLLCGILAAPALVWLFVCIVLQQLHSAPQILSQLAQQQDGVFNNLDQLSLDSKGGLRGVFNTVRLFREQQGLESIMETVSGISLLANPLFAMLAVICAGLLTLFVLFAALLLLF